MFTRQRPQRPASPLSPTGSAHSKPLAGSEPRGDAPSHEEYEAALRSLAGTVQSRRMREGDHRVSIADTILVLAALPGIRDAGIDAMLLWIDRELADLQQFLNRQAAAIDGHPVLESKWLNEAPRGQHACERLVSRLGLCIAARAG
jgi:hypothetical protein